MANNIIILLMKNMLPMVMRTNQQLFFFQDLFKDIKKTKNMKPVLFLILIALLITGCKEASSSKTTNVAA